MSALEEIVTNAARSLMDAYRQGVIDGKTEGYDEGYKAATTQFRVERLAMLQVWMALGGESQPFERWMENRTLVDAWHQLLAAISGDIAGLIEDSNPPAGELLDGLPVPEEAA